MTCAIRIYKDLEGCLSFSRDNQWMDMTGRCMSQEHACQRSEELELCGRFRKPTKTAEVGRQSACVKMFQGKWNLLCTCLQGNGFSAAHPEMNGL